MPDLNPAFHGSARINGSWGKHITAQNLGAIHYINQDAFSVPNSYPTTATSSITKIGDAPRTSPLNLWNPSKYELDSSVQRAFNLTKERVKFIFQADCLNVSNKVTFGGIQTAWSPSTTSSFGEVGSASGNRDFQFAGRIVF
jgi:hypothetical protein